MLCFPSPILSFFCFPSPVLSLPDVPFPIGTVSLPSASLLRVLLGLLLPFPNGTLPQGRESSSHLAIWAILVLVHNYFPYLGKYYNILWGRAGLGKVSTGKGTNGDWGLKYWEGDPLGKENIREGKHKRRETLGSLT